MPDFAQQRGDVALRFHRDSPWYVATQIGDVECRRIHANSERVVDLLHRLASHLDPVVDVIVDDERDEMSWEGALRFLPDVREALGRLRWPLASYGGVEITLVTPDDQLSLMPSLELVIYSRDDRWDRRLAAEGLARLAEAPKPIWRPSVANAAPALELRDALVTLAERLELKGHRRPRPSVERRR